MRILSICGVVTVAGVFGLMSCGKDAQTSDAQAKYGFLSDTELNLLDLKPDEKLLVCGTNEDNLREHAYVSVLKWMQASGRNFKVDVSENCRNKKLYHASVDMSFEGDHCELQVLGYHTQQGRHHSITNCTIAKQSNVSAQTVLHEVGHAFGLCDQYSPQNASHIVFHPNCRSDYRSLNPEKSIMGGGYPGSPSGLTSDDLLGIRIGACRVDQRGNNALWAKTQPEVFEGWKKDPLFNAEVKRLLQKGLKILPACILEGKVEEKENKEDVSENICTQLKQVAVLDSTRWFTNWKNFHFELRGSSENLAKVKKVEYLVHESFNDVLVGDKRSLSFASPQLQTQVSQWESASARVFTENGSCSLAGIKVKL